MGLVSQSIKNLKGGISQQPDILRFPDQGAQQVNALNSDVEGLQKRPPTVHIARLGANNHFGANPMCHIINRDEQERYSVMFTGSDIKITDLKTGNNIPVSAPNGLQYVASQEPRRDIKAVTVADFTFVINKTIRPLKGTETAPNTYGSEGRNALIVIKGAQFGRTFRIFCNGELFTSYKCPSGEAPEHLEQIDIQFCIKRLVEGFTGGAFHQAGWRMEQSSGYIWLKPPASDSIRTLRVEDGYNGQLAFAIINDVQKTTELPVEAPADYQVRVTGDAATGQDDYWVQYKADRKVWVEIPKPGVITTLFSESMPHILVREADGTFTFKVTEWVKRNAGDDDTNPWPSFLEEPINDVFFFRNRLGLLSGENVILSEAGEYFNFFPKSVAVSSDADPIDVAVSTNRISILKYAVPFAEELLLWSNQSQFTMSAEGILTHTSVKLNMATEFEVTDQARPFGLGRGVYFVSPRAKFSAVRRYYSVQDVTQVKNAEDISAHVPSYIPNGVFDIKGSSTENIVTVLTSGAPSKVFLYKFLYINETIAQQSWSHWELGTDAKVLSCELIGSTMYLIIDRPSGVFLERMEFTQQTKDFTQEPYRLYMDRKKVFTIPSDRFNDDTFTTSLTLSELYGATPTSGDYFVVLTDGSLHEFIMPESGWGTEGRLHIDGNAAGQTVIVGLKYEMLYEFSKFLIKKTDQSGNITTEDVGRLQLRRAWLNYANTGNFDVEVVNHNRKFLYTMTGKRAGTQGMVVGALALDTGQLRLPMSGNAKSLTVILKSDSPSPVSIIGGGWEGNYVRRSSGV